MARVEGSPIPSPVTRRESGTRQFDRGALEEGLSEPGGSLLSGRGDGEGLASMDAVIDRIVEVPEVTGSDSKVARWVADP